MKVVLILLLALSTRLAIVKGFQGPTSSRTRFSTVVIRAQEESSFLDRLPQIPSIPNPFEALESLKTPGADVAPASPDLAAATDKFEPSAAGLVAQARRVLFTDLGLQDPSLLDDDKFRWIGPVLDQPLAKTDYLAAGRFFDLRSAFPDLDYRAHDFRIDGADPSTVRLTCRYTGSMRGELRLRDEILTPTGDTMVCPPEAISMTFDTDSGKVVKLCTGFALDRLVGNTGGTTGVMAAATIAGKPPSEWDLYPATVVVQRFFGRPVRQLPDSKSFLAPFPETVMIQLAKGILAANMAAADPSLLSPAFTYCTPYIGPVGKSAFLEKIARAEFDGVDPEFNHFRVDPYDPVRVWVDVRPTAAGYEGPPQAMSFTFDEDGFCTRITSAAVMDPSLGNAGGLGGPEGYRYATGQASPAVATRPLPRVIGRLRKKVLEPFTGIGVDDYILPGEIITKPVQVEAPKRSQETQTLSPIEKLSNVGAARPPATKDTEEKKKKAKLVERQEKARKAAAERERLLEEQEKLEAQKFAAEKKKREADQALAVKKQARRKQQEAAQARAVEAKLKAETERKELEAKQRARAEQARALRTQKATQKTDAEQKRQQAGKAGATQAEARRKQEETRKAERERKRQEAERARAALAEARRKQQEAQKAEAERKRLEGERTRAAQAEARRKEEEVRKAAAESKRREAEQARAAQAEARQRMQEAQKAEAERKRQEAEQARAALEEARRKRQEAQKAETERKRQEAEQARAARAEAEQARAAQAEARQRRQEEKKAEAERKRKEAEQVRAALAEARRKRLEAQKAEAEQKRQEAERARAAQAEARRKQQEAKKAELEEKQAQQAAAREKQQSEKAALKTIASAPPRATIALFGFGGNAARDTEAAPAQKPKTATLPKKPKKAAVNQKPKTPAKKAPSGVPTLAKWRKNTDGSITGRISGSRGFSDGDLITTSPIARGLVKIGEVVTTGSGSRYFLS